MSPSRVDDFAMPPESRKRSATSDSSAPVAKKQKRSPWYSIPANQESPKKSPRSDATSYDAIARMGVRRGIALALDQVGFDSASEEAMESFTALVETYIESLLEDITCSATAARRVYAIPTDFEASLRHFNLPVSMLRPHTKPPIPKPKRKASWVDLPHDDMDNAVMPCLADELSGEPEKDSKEYIPKSFPSFPSLHTYKYTPEDAEAVTISEDWPTAAGPGIPTLSPEATLVNSSFSSQLLSQPQAQLQSRPLQPDEIPRGDPKKMREAAAKESKAGEEALRRLMRASKIAKQKEVWATAQREPARREHYDLWEAAMRELIEDENSHAGAGQGKEPGPSAAAGTVGAGVTLAGAGAIAMGRFEIADHSMIVNSANKFARKEVPRSGKRPVGAGEGLVGKG